MNRPVIDPPRLWALLGYPGGAPDPGSGEVVHSENSTAHVIEEVRLTTARGAVPGTLYRPHGPGPFPAILYCHAHGGRYDIGRRELAEGRPALQSPPYGPLLASLGFIVLCVDMPGFGDRQDEGTEGALAKAALWRGRTLFGDMLVDLSAALDWLAGSANVDAQRIATFGISMGATHAYWLAALDQRIAATAHLCAFSNIEGLIAAGSHDLHGIYMSVPGLLQTGDMGDVATLIAPRPQLVGAGGMDPLTPVEALDPALATLRDAYAAAGAADRLTVLVSPETGHAETPDMRESVLALLDRSIGRSGSGRISL